jgi:hypothetical protein
MTDNIVVNMSICNDRILKEYNHNIIYNYLKSSRVEWCETRINHTAC